MLLPVARMSEATSGIKRAAEENPHVAGAHAGYGGSTQLNRSGSCAVIQSHSGWKLK